MDKDKNKDLEEALLTLYKVITEHTKDKVLERLKDDFYKIEKDMATAIAQSNKDIQDESYKNCPYYKDETE